MSTDTPLNNRELFEKFKEARFEWNSTLQNLVLARHGAKQENVTEDQLTAVDKFAENFSKAVDYRWQRSDRSYSKFSKKFSPWLSEAVSIPELKAPRAADGSATPKKGGRPPKEFADLTNRAQNRSTAPLREENSCEKLLHAATVKLREEGKSSLASLIQDANKSPTRPAKILRISGIADTFDRVPKIDIHLPSKILPQAALAFILQHNMTKGAYVALRLISKQNSADIWPSYKEVLKAKEKSRPENIQYDEAAVSVGLSDRLAKNDAAFMELCETEIGLLLRDVEIGGTLRVDCEGKVGFDGSTGHSMFNQKFSLENRDKTDSSLLATCYVPLQYRVSGGEPIFTNPAPQSSSFCQPLRLEFRKETKDASIEIDR